MSISFKFILFQILVIGPFLMGMFGKRYFVSPDQTARRIVLFNLCVFDPILILWTVWGLELSPSLVFLPLAGLSIVVIGFVVGYFLALPLHLSRKNHATFVITASLSNHGFTLGGFICYLLLGEQGLALSYIFLIYFVFYLFMFIFPYARWIQATQAPLSRRKLIVDSLVNVRNIPLYTTLIALALQKYQIKRISIDMPVDMLLLISISIYYFSLGMTYSLTRQIMYKKINVLLAIIKFVIIPMVALILTLILPLDPLMKSVVMIQSFMPAAIFSVVASIIFELDTRMSSNLFVWNTIIFLLFVFPLLYFFTQIS
ncbi:MAG: AEC family transporter [Candidatus Magnetomorum sp.]|nr:AEC family transporter [Candidatus Magnetomorum sp.]